MQISRIRQDSYKDSKGRKTDGNTLCLTVHLMAHQELDLYFQTS